MEHGEDGGYADAGTQQDDGSVAWPQRETAARRADVEHLANSDLSIDIGSGCAVGFSFDADAIAILARLARQRVAAQESGCIGRRPEPQYDKLPGQGGFQRVPIGGLEHERGHAAALAGLARYEQRAEPRPCRRRPAAGASPGLPVVASPLCSRSSSAWKE